MLLLLIYGSNGSVSRYGYVKYGIAHYDSLRLLIF